MKTLKIYLNEDGSIRDYTQDFVINQYSFQDSLINVYVPTSILDLRNTDTTIEDSDTGAIIHTINGSDVQMGLIYTNSNGTTRVGDGYLFNFVKSNIIVNNVNYTLFERLMPKEFSLYAGENNYALNVVNVRTISTTLNGETTTESFATSLITSATYHLYITASANFDTTTEETTDLENLQAQVNGIVDDLANKQDKEDSSINVYTNSTHTETTQNVVEGLNDLNARVGTNESDLTTLKPQVQTNTEDIAELKNQVICDAIYVGSITENTEPNATALTNFVISEGYTLKSGDTVIWIYQISGATDKSYKCMYGASGWSWYEIPPIESASNGTKGIVAGTYGVDNYNTLVNIVDGKIIGIYCKKADNTYEEITNITQSLQATITNIINGTLSIDSADYATYDSTEKSKVVKTAINDKFTTPSQVSSAIQDYAMPKVFNEVYFFDFTNNTMVDEPETITTKVIDLSTIGNKTSTYTQSVSIPHKINRNNTFQVQLYVGATNLVNDTNASFTLRLIDENNNDITLGTSIATIKAATETQLVNFVGYTWEVQSEIEVSTACHYELDITILNEYSNNGNITLYNGITDALSTYILSLPFGSFELSEAKKGEVFNINATCSYQENEDLETETIEKTLYVGISTGDFNPSNYTSSEYVATHIKATYSALAELDADTNVKAIINGVEYTIYSPQCNDMLYGYFKSVQASKTLLNGTYTYTFEFDSIFNSTNGFYIDIPYSNIVRLTQTEYNTLSTASLLNDKLNYVITDEDSFVELALKIKNATPITYSSLVLLISNNALVLGNWYRITDYETTTTDTQTRSAGHVFDILVQPLSNNELNPIAFATNHSGDTYFANSDLSKWVLKYDINNDTNKYLWADSVNGKGVIYYMLDEFGNECPYDFKNIQFKRYKITAATTNTNCIGYYLGFASDYLSSDVPYGLTQDTTDYIYCYTFNHQSDNTDLSLTYVSASQFAEHNIIKECYYNSPTYRKELILNNIVLSATFVNSNNIDIESHHNTLYCEGNDIGINEFKMLFRDNAFIGNINHNWFGDCAEHNTIGLGVNSVGKFNWNRITGDHFSYNKITDDFHFNTIPTSTFTDNTITAAFYNNVAYRVFNNTFNGIMIRCTFDYVNNTTSNIIFQDTKFGYVLNTTFEKDNDYSGTVGFINGEIKRTAHVRFTDIVGVFAWVNIQPIKTGTAANPIIIPYHNSLSALLAATKDIYCLNDKLFFKTNELDTNNQLTSQVYYKGLTDASWTNAPQSGGGSTITMFSDYDILTAINGKTLNGEAFKTFLNNLDETVDFSLEGVIVESAYVLYEDSPAFSLYNQKSGTDNDYTIVVYGIVVYGSGNTASTFDNLIVECDELDYTDPLDMLTAQRYIAPLVSVFDSEGNSKIVKFDWQDFIDCFE